MCEHFYVTTTARATIGCRATLEEQSPSLICVLLVHENTTILHSSNYHRWYIFSDYVFLSSSRTDIPEPNIRAHYQSTATAIMTCTPYSERVALQRRMKIALHKKCASGLLHIHAKSKQDDLYRSISKLVRLIEIIYNGSMV